AQPRKHAARPGARSGRCRRRWCGGWRWCGRILCGHGSLFPRPPLDIRIFSPTIAHMQVATAPDRLPWTGDDEADRLLAADPLALLIGFVLDQQVPLQKAFIGPLELCRRIGTLDARTIADMDTTRLE